MKQVMSAIIVKLPAKFLLVNCALNDFQGIIKTTPYMPVSLFVQLVR